ncbi:MAG TPA: transcriptional repressor [Deltaproteobacteria bacterium]|nr:transcriptional repressor [Deltaproteobacteria bacterium]
METLKRYLEREGLKSTSQRDFIAQTFFKTNTHISIDELLKKVRRKNPSIGYATVYRTMKLLVDSGLAIARHFGDNQTRYENIPKDGHHDHIICVKCLKIVEFHDQKIEDIQDEIARNAGFEVINHKLEIYGYCPACSAGR